MTRKRQALLDVLRQARAPLNAAQVFEQIKAYSDLATVYRGLHFLERQHYLTSFVFDCQNRGVERYYTVRRAGHEHYLHCESCHRFFALTGCPLEKAAGQIEQEYGFRIKEHSLTIKGTCLECEG